MNAEINLYDASGASLLKQDLLVFFVPGNPGIIEYYRTFLTHLYGLLSYQSPEAHEAVHSDINLHVYGRNLAGYGTCDCRNNFDEDEDLRKRLPLGLQGQVEYVEEALHDRVRKIGEKKDYVRSGDAGGPSPSKSCQVILIGHSLGTYINLELLRRRRDRVRLQSTVSESIVPDDNRISTAIQPSRKHSGIETSHGSVYDLIGIINVAPTVSDLASSPSGERVTTGVSFGFVISSLLRYSKSAGVIGLLSAPCLFNCVFPPIK